MNPLSRIMQVVNLRECPDAIPMLADWHYREWSHLYPNETQESFAEGLRISLEENIVPSTWILRDEQGVWGSASIIEQDMDTNQELGPWLASVYIHPEKRGRKLGSYLIQAVMENARASGLDKLYLFTPGQSAFYQQLGWRSLKTENYQSERVDIMTATL